MRFGEKYLKQKKKENKMELSQVEVMNIIKGAIKNHYHIKHCKEIDVNGNIHVVIRESKVSDEFKVVSFGDFIDGLLKKEDQTKENGE